MRDCVRHHILLGKSTVGVKSLHQFVDAMVRGGTRWHLVDGRWVEHTFELRVNADLCPQSYERGDRKQRQPGMQQLQTLINHYSPQDALFLRLYRVSYNETNDRQPSRLPFVLAFHPSHTRGWQLIRQEPKFVGNIPFRRYKW